MKDKKILRLTSFAQDDRDSGFSLRMTKTRLAWDDKNLPVFGLCLHMKTLPEIGQRLRFVLRKDQTARKNFTRKIRLST